MEDLDRQYDVICAVFGMPGPVANGKIAEMADIPAWGSLDEKELERLTSIPKVKMINDFVAVGYGVIGLKKCQIKVLN